MATAETDDDKAPQDVVAGKYRLTNLLGRGGMGAVWEGVHLSLGTRVAVKFIDKQHASSNEIRQRFVNEAKAAARLRSKHVVQVYDQGVTEDGRPYIVMEFLGGEPLDARLDRVGRLSPEDTGRIMVQVARALAKAHDGKIIHRDLKPENVFLVWDEEDQMDIVKVVDFGIAKFSDSTEGPTSGSTRTGAVLGTPHYMSPEQARGLRSVDHRTDIWSMGVIAYRCIVGRLPFEGEAVGDLLVNICTGAPPIPSVVLPGTPVAFDDVVKKALAREPPDRYSTAMEFGDALCRACGIDVRAPAQSMALSSSRGAPRSVPAPGVKRSQNAVTEVPLTNTLSGSGSRKPLLIALALAGAAAIGVVGFFGARAMKAPSGVPATAAEPIPAASLRPSAPPEAKVEPPAVTPAVSPPETPKEGENGKEVAVDKAENAATEKAAVARPVSKSVARSPSAPSVKAKQSATSKASKPPADLLGH